MKQQQPDSVCIKAIIGLGNPGKQYEKTRHNIGFRVVDLLVERYEGTWRVVDQAVVSHIRVNDHSVIVVKPLTYMNASGKVFPLIKKEGIKIDELLVVHDELEFPFGKVTKKYGGSSRGHNGLKSIIAQGGDGFWRIRCGIGRPADAADVASYVLAPFKELGGEVDEMVTRACDLSEELLRQPC